TGRNLLACILAIAACAGSPPLQIRKLASGEEIKVLGIGKLKSSPSGPSLVLRYQTDLNMDDPDAVHAEAERIWGEFRKDADSAHVQSAIVSANAPPSGGGVITHVRTYNFVFERAAGGGWHEIRRD